MISSAFATSQSTEHDGAQTKRVQKVKSQKNIEAWLVEDHTLPIISINFAFKGGSSQDPEAKPGVANLVAETLDEGAGNLESLSFQTALDDRAIKLSFDASRNAFYGQIRTLTAELETALKLASAALNVPRFDEEPVERMRAQIIAQLRNELNDPDAMASRLFSKTLFPNHPYGRPSNGDLETIETLTKDDLTTYHKEILAQDNLVIGVVGAISQEELKKALDKLFGSLPAKAKLKKIAQIVPKTDLVIMQSEDIPQTVMRFGGPAPLRKEDAFMPAFIVNHILGGGVFSSRLFNEVREKRGLAYSVYTYLTDFDYAGLYAGGVSTRTDRADEAIQLIRQEIKRMGEEGPTELELKEAKQFLIGSYALRFDTSSKIARQLVELQLSDLGSDYFEKRNALIEAVTLEEVKQVARFMYEKTPTIIKVGQKEVLSQEQ